MAKKIKLRASERIVAVGWAKVSQHEWVVNAWTGPQDALSAAAVARLLHDLQVVADRICRNASDDFYDVAALYRHEMPKMAVRNGALAGLVEFLLVADASRSDNYALIDSLGELRAALKDA